MKPMTPFVIHSRLLPVGEDTGDNSIRKFARCRRRAAKMPSEGLQQC